MMETVERAEIAKLRQACRDEWVQTVVLAFDRLDPAIVRHCLDRDNLVQWWPGTKSGDEDLPKMKGKQQWK